MGRKPHYPYAWPPNLHSMGVGKFGMNINQNHTGNVSPALHQHGYKMEQYELYHSNYNNQNQCIALGQTIPEEAGQFTAQATGFLRGIKHGSVCKRSFQRIAYGPADIITDINGEIKLPVTHNEKTYFLDVVNNYVEEFAYSKEVTDPMMREII